MMIKTICGYVPYSKNIAGKKTLTNLVNYSNLPSFLPIFTISTTFPMLLDFNSPKFILPNFLKPLFTKIFYRQSFYYTV